jgi:hypothetical protein
MLLGTGRTTHAYSHLWSLFAMITDRAEVPKTYSFLTLVHCRFS